MICYKKIKVVFICLELTLLCGLFSCATNPFSDSNNSVDLSHPKLAKSIKDGTQPTSKIELTTWHEWQQRKLYRSKTNNIAFSFDIKNIIESSFYGNIFTYNFNDTFDYFCIPDDYVIAYNNQKSFRVKALALSWRLKHGLKNNGEEAFVSYVYKQEYGFSDFVVNESDKDGSKEHGTIEKSSWSAPRTTKSRAYNVLQ